ncbi:MAG: hypothetical protein M9927_09030 [Anaerolineae bacterium]|nr:hypothetical protein [Anaerolineae bacterium]
MVYFTWLPAGEGVRGEGDEGGFQVGMSNSTIILCGPGWDGSPAQLRNGRLRRGVDFEHGGVFASSAVAGRQWLLGEHQSS